MCVESRVGFGLIQTWNTGFTPSHTCHVHPHPRPDSLCPTKSVLECVCCSLLYRCVTAWLCNPQHICIPTRLSAASHELCKSIRLRTGGGRRWREEQGHWGTQSTSIPLRSSSNKKQKQRSVKWPYVSFLNLYSVLKDAKLNVQTKHFFMRKTEGRAEAAKQVDAVRTLLYSQTALLEKTNSLFFLKKTKQMVLNKYT